MPKEDKTEEAFQKYLTNPDIVRAREAVTERRGAEITDLLLRDCFIAGAQYAIQRCKDEHHRG